MSVSDKLLLQKLAIIEKVNDELKNTRMYREKRRGVFSGFLVDN